MKYYTWTTWTTHLGLCTDNEIHVMAFTLLLRILFISNLLFLLNTRFLWLEISQIRDSLTLNLIFSSLQVGRIECSTCLAPPCTSCSSITMVNSAIPSLAKVGLPFPVPQLLVIWWCPLVVAAVAVAAEELLLLEDFESVRWISEPMTKRN